MNQIAAPVEPHRLLDESIGALVLAVVAMAIFAQAWSLRPTGLRPTLETGRPEGQ
jgi:hypothetical protein